MYLCVEPYFEESFQEQNLTYYPETDYTLTDLNDVQNQQNVSSQGILKCISKCSFNCLWYLATESEKVARAPSTINEAFDQLRDVVPSFPYERRISKIETLRLALRKALRSVIIVSRSN